MANLNAERRLASILRTGELRAFPAHGTDGVSVIGASDVSPADLQAAFRTGLNTRGPFEPWALVLDRETTWAAGARPVLYADYGEREVVRAALEARASGRGALVQRIDINMYRSDWTHEREWRWIAHAGRDSLPVWAFIKAVIVGTSGWMPPRLRTNADAERVRRWWWVAGELIDDGMLSEPSPYE